MLRLSLLLCIGMYAALMTLGENRGQLRPGLAKAVAEGRLATGRNGIEAEPVQIVAADPELMPEPAPEPEPVALPEPEPEPVVAEAPILPEPMLPEPAPPVDIAAGREVVEVLEDPVFSLASLGNETVPGEDGTPVAEPLAEPLAEPEPLDAAPVSPAGAVWYVNATSVNLRAAPSTEAEILAKLASGEAMLILAQVDADWAEIVTQSDGQQGYVALRYLSPVAP